MIAESSELTESYSGTGNKTAIYRYNICRIEMKHLERLRCWNITVKAIQVLKLAQPVFQGFKHTNVTHTTFREILVINQLDAQNFVLQ